MTKTGTHLEGYGIINFLFLHNFTRFYDIFSYIYMVFISTLFLCQELHLHVLIRSRQYWHVHPRHNHLHFDSMPKTKTTHTAHNFSIFMDHVSSALPPSFKSSRVFRQVNRSIQVHAESYILIF